MEFNENLFNAAVVGENGDSPNIAFIAEKNRLHAVEQHIADKQKNKSDPKVVVPLMRDALNALLQFAKGKIPSQFVEVDLKAISLKPDEQEQFIEKLKNIYTHLPHQERNKLMSLIHHKFR